MTSVCLLTVLLFSEQGETMQCALHVWKDEHEQTETAVSISVFNYQKIIFKKELKTEIETAVSG